MSTPVIVYKYFKSALSFLFQMKTKVIILSLPVAASLLLFAGCGGDDASLDVSLAPAPQPQAAPQVAVMPSAPAPAVAAPPTGSAPAAMEPAAPDLFSNYKASPDGKTKTDVEAMQAIVDGYAFGPEGLGAPPLATLDDLVKSGYIKRLPPAPNGMKWAYDPSQWKVSVVPK
jgi:hypothetical protein